MTIAKFKSIHAQKYLPLASLVVMKADRSNLKCEFGHARPKWFVAWVHSAIGTDEYSFNAALQLRKECKTEYTESSIKTDVNCATDALN